MFYLVESTGDYIDTELVTGVRKLQKTWQVLIHEQEPILLSHQEQVLDLIEAIARNSKEERWEKLFKAVEEWMEKLASKYGASPVVPAQVAPAYVRSDPESEREVRRCPDDERCFAVKLNGHPLDSSILGVFTSFIDAENVYHHHRVNNMVEWERAQAIVEQDKPDVVSIEV